MNITPKIVTEELESTFSDTMWPFLLLYSPIGLAVINAGGYFAGGLPHSMLMLGEQFNAKYFKKGGDIDVFFRSASCHAAAVQAITSLKKDFTPTKSLAGHCSNIIVDIGSTLSIPVGGSFRENGIKIQLVSSHYGEPSDLIARFDLVNSMIGFDEKQAYVADGLRELIASRTLETARDELDTTYISRLAKYCDRHQYTHLSSRTLRSLVRWADKYYMSNVNNGHHVQFGSFDIKEHVISYNAIKRLLTSPAGVNIPTDVVSQLVGMCLTVRGVPSSDEDPCMYTGETFIADEVLDVLADRGVIGQALETARTLSLSRMKDCELARERASMQPIETEDRLTFAVDEVVGWDTALAEPF